ncbi:hypothetical protein [Borrelia crocidurae]|uniref:hypothetical protein n=1 Tax=Borrelia crocidurae TaxID=29520 RepID=UPI0032201BCB
MLRILDLIIRKTVSNNLEKVKETAKGIKYSESIGEAIEAGTVTYTTTQNINTNKIISIVAQKLFHYYATSFTLFNQREYIKIKEKQLLQRNVFSLIVFII